MAKIHQSIQGVLAFFDQYKGEDGVLDKKEFRAIVEKECKGNIDESVLDKLFDRLDQNKDGKLDMEEYSAVVGLLIKACYYKKIGEGRCAGKGSCK
ncbi:protein S100-A11-like [Hippocampus zosterae]|uniref:protein S100-A11-like n=1 Tax=Hippocampus zosterae TaxID=109293 RepID=UPI00223D6925|nr:protein S100-A11-like [Hippocampus zosterae]XP_051922205.1 protein S100-A11-like [Hippocampus zosterae]